MRQALRLAIKGRGRTSPNPLVGALVVKDGVVVGRGFHAKAGTPHAEIHALKEAGHRAKGATLYVNLEPCCHYGRTGPCTEAIIEAGIKRVVVAMTDPNPLVSGKGIKRLLEAGLEVTAGVLEKEARQLNEVFVKYITAGRPFVVCKAAVSLDGKIATRSGQSKWITSPEARAYAHRLRDWYDAVLVGIGTVLSDDPLLTARLPNGRGRNPVKVIVDSKARIPVNARVFSEESPAPTILATTKGAPPEKLEEIAAAGAQVVVVNEGPRVDLQLLMDLLAEKEITSVLIEGGAEVHASAFRSKIVDKVVWFIAPKLIGGREAPGPIGGEGIENLREALALERVKLKKIGPDIYVEGYPNYSSDGD